MKSTGAGLARTLFKLLDEVVHDFLEFRGVDSEGLLEFLDVL